MSITIRISGSRYSWLKRLLKLELSPKAFLLLSFALSFIVRLVPELTFPVPVGFDTALYVAGAKHNPHPSFEFRILQKFILPYVYHVLGIDLIFFMKIFAPLVHALITMLMMLYAIRILSWSRTRLLVLMLLLSLSPAILRMAWDTHSQNLATLMLAGMLLIMGKRLTFVKFLSIMPVLALIALTHQLVSVIALVILFAEVLASVKRPREFVPMTFIFLACLLIVVYLDPVLNPLKVSMRVMTVISPQATSPITPQTLALQGLVATWYIAPAAVVGVFRERRLLAWTITSIGVFLAGFFLANPAPLVPGRWIVYSSIPLAFFASNAITKKGSWKKSLAVIFIILTLSTGFGMLLPTGTPVTSIMHKAYPEMPETLASSTAKKEHIEAIIEFTRYLNIMDREGCLVTHYPWFFWWSWYFYEGKTLYNGPSYTTEQSLKTFVETRATKCSNTYVIWFTGLTWAKEIKRIGELALYEYQPTRG